MSFSKWERISGYVLYTKLCGDNHIRGLFFEHPEDITDIENTRKVVDSLSEEDINSPYALMLLAKQSIKEADSAENLYKDALKQWLPKAKPDVVNKSFEELSVSLTWENALQSKEVYEIFFKEGQVDNPWTQENCNKPGYAVLPLFSLRDENFPKIMPARAVDQKAFMNTIEDLKTLNDTSDEDLISCRNRKIISKLKQQWYELHPQYQQLRTKNIKGL